MSTPEQRIIEGAYKILSSPERWTRKVLARKANKRHAEHVDSHDAVCFCVEGALLRSSIDTKLGYQGYFDATVYARRAAGFLTLWRWNDDPTTTHADILRVLREAHKLAGEDGPEVIA